MMQSIFLMTSLSSIENQHPFYQVIIKIRVLINKQTRMLSQHRVKTQTRIATQNLRTEICAR